MFKQIAAATVMAATAIPALAAPPVNCEDAPTEAVIQVPEPASALALVFCAPSGHVLAPTDGFLWIGPDRKPFFFNASSLRGQVKGGSKNGSYFTRAVARTLSGESLEKARGMYRVEFSEGAPENTSVTQLDLDANSGIRYNIFFYTMNGKVDRVIGCVDRCDTSVGLKQYSLSELR